MLERLTSWAVRRLRHWETSCKLEPASPNVACHDEEHALALVLGLDAAPEDCAMPEIWQWILPFWAFCGGLIAGVSGREMLQWIHDREEDRLATLRERMKEKRSQGRIVEFVGAQRPERTLPEG